MRRATATTGAGFMIDSGQLQVEERYRHAPRARSSQKFWSREPLQFES
jgi:hypothetical protein